PHNPARLPNCRWACRATINGQSKKAQRSCASVRPFLVGGHYPTRITGPVQQAPIKPNSGSASPPDVKAECNRLINLAAALTSSWLNNKPMTAYDRRFNNDGRRKVVATTLDSRICGRMADGVSE